MDLLNRNFRADLPKSMDKSKFCLDGCESFHNQFFYMFYQSHPSMSDFMGKQSCEDKTYLETRTS